jgi:LacI family transcriptional regulator
MHDKAIFELPLDITQKEVAEKAKVSIMTVSRVINNSESVAPATREKIQKAIEELGYHPNNAARSLAKRKTGIIGVVASLPENIGLESHPYFLQLIQGIEWALIQNSYDLLLSTQRRKESEDFAYFRLYREKKVDGLIFLGGNFQEKHKDLVRNSKIPCCVVGEDADPSIFNVVDSKNKNAIHFLVDHLVEKGHTDLGFINSTVQTYHIKERYAGFRAALKKHNLKEHAEWVYYGDFSEGSGQKVAHELMIQKNRPSAIIAGTDTMAMGLIGELSLHGWSIPRDLAVAGFDAIQQSQSMIPSLTSIRQPLIKMGERAAGLVLESINNPEYRPQKAEFDNQLIIGSSS